MVPLDRVVDVLWAAAPPADPAANVATLVSRSRRLLGEGVLAATGRAYGIASEACTVDLDEAGALTDEAASRLAAGESALAAAAARRALDLLGSPPALPDEPDADWVLPGTRGRPTTCDAVPATCSPRRVTASEPAEAAGVAADAVAADPYDERAVRNLMRALVARDRPQPRSRRTTTWPAGSATSWGSTRRPRPPRSISRSCARRRCPARRMASRAPTGGRGRTASGARRSRDRARHAGPACGRTPAPVSGTSSSSRVSAASGRPGCSTRPPTSPTPAAGSCSVRAATLPSGPCSCSPTSTRCGRCCSGLGAADLERPPARAHRLRGSGCCPSSAELVEARPEPPAAPAIERRRAYDAVAAVLGRLARRRPLLLAVDDLQDGGAATVDLLGLPGRSADRSRGPARRCGAQPRTRTTVARLADRAIRVTLDALPSGGGRGARRGGRPVRARRRGAWRRTAGHSLSVVEYLRALAAGDAGVPESLAAAMPARVDRLRARRGELVQGASVLRGAARPAAARPTSSASTSWPPCGCARSWPLVGLLHRESARTTSSSTTWPRSASTARCRRPLVRGLPPTGRRPAQRPARVDGGARLSRRASPDARRTGWLLAGQAAMGRSAVEDAIGALRPGAGRGGGPARCARGCCWPGPGPTRPPRRTPRRWPTSTRRWPWRAGRADRRLEMAALRARGGDVPVGAAACRWSEMGAHLEAGLRLATGLGDRAARGRLHQPG